MAMETTAGNVTLEKEAVRSVIKCITCGKSWRVFAKKKLLVEQSEELQIWTEDYEYSCGLVLVPTGHSLHDVVAVQLGLSCSTHIEWV